MIIYFNENIKYVKRDNFIMLDWSEISLILKFLLMNLKDFIEL